MSQRLYETAVAVLGPDALLMPATTATRSTGTVGARPARVACQLDHGRHERDPAQHHRRAAARPAAGAEEATSDDRRRRRARPHRSGALRRARAIRTTCGRDCGPRRRSRTSRRTGYEPFWAITKHADILEISKQPLRFSSAQGSRCARPASCSRRRRWSSCSTPPARAGAPRRERGASRRGRCGPARRHRAHRDRDPRRGRAGGQRRASSTSSSASPRRSRSAVIAWILGVPSDDWELLFRWTNEVIGKDDPEYRRPGETPGQTSKRARGELHAYFRTLIDAAPDRPAGRPGQRADPRRDRRHAAHRGAARLVLRAPRRGGQRDDAQRDQRRSARVLRAPRRVGEAAGATRSSCPTRSRRSCAGPARSATSPAPPPRTARCAGTTIRAGEQVALVLRVGEPRRGGVRRPVRVPRRSPPEPAPRVRLRRALLHGRARRPRRARDDLPPPARRASTRSRSPGPVERLSSIVNGSIKHLPLRYGTTEKLQTER